MIQFSRFSNGGYVLHKIRGNTSAWYDRDGKLLDAESRDRLGRMRPVTKDGPTWQELHRIGQRYKHAPSDHGQRVRPYDENPARMAKHITSFAEADAFYQGSRYPHKLGHNTHVFRVVDDGLRAAAIRYHKTDIVTYREDGSIKLNSGGYRTVSTKSHMNSVLPPGVGVFQTKGEWFVQLGGYDKPHSQTVEFFDGMIIKDSDARPYDTNPKAAPALDEFYANVFVTALEGGIGYWSYAKEYVIENTDADDVVSPFAPGYHAVVVDGEDEDEKEHRIDRATIARGFGLATGSKELKYVSDGWRKRMREAYREKDAGDVDSSDADNIVQLGLFGEIVYG